MENLKHYFALRNEDEFIPEYILEEVKQVLAKYPDLRREIIGDAKPVVNGKMIAFNGSGENGHETFMLSDMFRDDFVITDLKPYDLAVCEVLLLLKGRMNEGFRLKSDYFNVTMPNFFKKQLGGNWDVALENLKKQFKDLDVEFFPTIEFENDSYEFSYSVEVEDKGKLDLSLVKDFVEKHLEILEIVKESDDTGFTNGEKEILQEATDDILNFLNHYASNHYVEIEQKEVVKAIEAKLNAFVEEM